MVSAILQRVDSAKLLFFNIVVHNRPTPCRFMLFKRFFSGTFLTSSDTMEKSSKSSSTPSAGRRSRQRRSAEKKNSVGGSVGQLSLLASTADGRKRKSKAGTQLKNANYSCAYQKEILLHGRMYLSQNWLCFYSNIFKWETQVTIRYKDIVAVTKERTAKIIPNAIYVMLHPSLHYLLHVKMFNLNGKFRIFFTQEKIVVTNTNEKLFFTSFSARDKTFMMLFRLWQYALLDQVVYPGDMWSWAQHGYDEADLSESEVEEEAAVAYEELGATYGAEMVVSSSF
ncbi:GRAM domain protein [Trichinella nativa]|uniref:GRAM domain protein n=1 Tax=Trichinella nativa TaxID=6335 RepID=A0A1Y3EVZ6_9BILA|nr:GRAM domain protein [Trichinella nativa]